MNTLCCAHKPPTLSFLFLSISAPPHRSGTFIQGSRTELDSVAVKLAQFARPTGSAGRNTSGCHKYRRTLCTAVLLSTLAGSIVCGRSSCSSGCCGSQRRVLFESIWKWKLFDACDLSVSFDCRPGARKCSLSTSLVFTNAQPGSCGCI